MRLESEHDPPEPVGSDPGPDEAADPEAPLEPEPEPSPEAAQELRERFYPRTIGGVFYLLILVGTAVGVGIVASGDWRLGIRCVGGALCFAAVCRLVLRNRDAGMLAVRSRPVDALILAGLGLALFFLATTIPNQPGV